VATQPWEVPSIPDSEFAFRVGTSVLEEFARSHTPADALRELVQNEYDAGGASMEVDFEDDLLVVRGSGTPIDQKGWQRLTVVLGTGLVGGSGERIPAKVNGVGSKNLGLRSLFLFGDQIFVSSAGRMTVLDRTSGVLGRLLSDPETIGQRGVVLRVPYRSNGNGLLQHFGIDAERDAFLSFAEELAPTLVKLTLPGKDRGLRKVVVRSRRLGAELAWSQSSRFRNGRAGRLDRSVRIRCQGAEVDRGPTTISEIEYSRNLAVPGRYRGRDTPSYFRIPGGRIRLALSFRAARGKIDLGAAGVFYYPLGASRSRTGFPFSLCAPFEMNEDRSQLVDLGNSSWNQWLVEQCAQLAIDLLVSELFGDFGADAYLAFSADRTTSSTVPGLVDAITSRLASQACWPSRATAGRARKPVFDAAKTLTTPASPTLAEIVHACLRPAEACHPALSENAHARELATSYGAKLFTANSLVRLWCSGTDSGGLAAKPSADEADFTDAVRLRKLPLQRRLAEALDAVQERLSDRHRSDLRRSAMVLSAAMTQAPLGELWVVDPVLAEVIPAEQCLHPRLAEYGVLRTLSRPFYPSSWVIEACDRLRSGQGSESERDALARLLRQGPSISAKAWAAARRAPVFRDHRGDWAAAEDLVSRRTPSATLLTAALRHPKAEDERNPRLARLRIRATLRPDDLVTLARLVEAEVEPSETIATAITRLPRLLTPAAVRQLQHIAFIRTTTGALVAPSHAYVRTDRLVAALGEEGPFASDLPLKILKQLKCRNLPPVDDLIGALRLRQERDEPLARPDLAYRVLVDAATAQRRSLDAYRHETILWTESGWEAPASCLTGSDHASLFRDAVPVLTGSLDELYRALGVPAKPEPVHWRRLLEWAGRCYGNGRPVPHPIAQRLARAYHRLGAPPAGLPPTTSCLLDENGVLHTPAHAAQGRLLINDDPFLADAARASADVAFVPADQPEAHRFLRAAGVKSLTAVAQLERTSWDAEVEPGTAIHVQSALIRLHRPDFASALHALATALRHSSTVGPASRIASALTAVQQIALVENITRRYRIHGTPVDVAVEYAFQQSRILLSLARTQHEFWELLSAAIAALADPSDTSDALRDPIYFLLRCTTSHQLRRELARRKIAWQPASVIWADDEESDADPGTEVVDTTTLIAEVIGNAVSEPLPTLPPSPTAPIVPSTPASRPPRSPLPELDDVHPKTITGVPQPTPNPTSGGYRGTPFWWQPRDDRDEDEDRELGRRGEEMVLRHLREQLGAAGGSTTTVTWVADGQPLANHDIRIDDPESGTTWVEVKATTGRHGRFRWPRAEFQLALQARDRYLLYRVYEADTTSPTLLEIRDPVGHFQEGHLDLGLDSLAGDMGPIQ
jgi:Domain of unknown function (DUF3883)